MKKVTLKIGGMSCSACSNGLEKFLNKQDGIYEASVNLVMNNATIQYDEKVLNIEGLGLLVKKAGFESLGLENFKKEDNKRERKRKRIEIYILLVLCILMMYISMGHMIGLPILNIIDMNVNPKNYCLVLLVLSLPSLYLGKDILYNGYKNLVNLMPNMDTLVSIGILSSLLFSIYETILVILGNELSHVYFESSVMIVFFLKIGRYIDNLSKSKTTEAIQDLMLLTPSSAQVLKNGKIENVTIDEINKGDIVICKSGETIAVDGRIVNGEITINESFITGESVPKAKSVGDMVIAGSINCDGYIEYEAIKIGKESTVSEIVRMVVEATNTKAPISRIADIVSKYFVLGVLIIAILGFCGYLVFAKDFSKAINIFVTVLVVACPCALGLATPIAMVVSNGKSARNGILVKNNAILEAFHKINTLVFDKTGTLTEGSLKIQEEYYFNNVDRIKALQMMGSVEKGSIHPIAKAIERKIQEENINLLEISEFMNISGKGVKANIDKKEILVGNEKLLDEFGVVPSKEEKEAIAKVKENGNTLLLLAEDKKIIAVLGAKDKVKESSKPIIEKLKKRNIEVIMLTGDSSASATSIAKELKIDRVISDVLPKEKASLIKKLQDEGKLVAMVGDGINDAPSLALSDIGISISCATDIAINSADVVLMEDDLEKINTLYDISKKTIKIVKENLFWAFLYNICLIPIALGAFSFLGLTINPMIASFAMMFSSLSVILNALRLR